MALIFNLIIASYSMGNKNNIYAYIREQTTVWQQIKRWGMLVAYTWNNQMKIMIIKSLVQCTTVVSAKSAKM